MPFYKGEVKVEKPEKTASGGFKWSIINPEPYREFVDSELPEIGMTATLDVDTGRVNEDQKPKRFSSGGLSIPPGRGEVEFGHERGFRMVAAERGLAIKVTTQHTGDNVTQMRVQLLEKRELSDTAVEKREAGQRRRLIKDRTAKKVAEYAEENGRPVTEEEEAAIYNAVEKAYDAEKAKKKADAEKASAPVKKASAPASKAS